MSLRSLTLLVLLVLAGTAASVRWYLQADEGAAPAPEVVAPAPALEHVPLPMWAEPARRPTARASSHGSTGVAHGGQGVPWIWVPVSEDPEPAGALRN